MLEFLTLQRSPFAGEAKIVVGKIRHHFRDRSKDHLSHCRAVRTPSVPPL